MVGVSFERELEVNLRVCAAVSDVGYVPGLTPEIPLRTEVWVLSGYNIAILWSGETAEI